MENRNLASSIGNKIRTLRLNSGLSQEQLADELKVHSNYIYMLEKGKRNITLIKFVKLLKVFKVMPNAFIDAKLFD